MALIVDSLPAPVGRQGSVYFLKVGDIMNKWFSALCVAIGAAAQYLGSFLFK